MLKAFAFLLFGILLMAADQPTGPGSAPPSFAPLLPVQAAPPGAPGAPGGPEGTPEGAQPGGPGGEGTGYAASTMGEATVQYDPMTRSLIVVTDEATNEKIKTVVESLDRPIPQVLIKVLFLEVTHNKDIDLGTEWATFDIDRNINYLAEGVAGRNSDGTIIGSDAPAVLGQFLNTDVNGDIIRRPVESLTEHTFGTAYGIGAENEGAFYRVVGRDCNALIRALGTVGNLEVLSRPSILTRSNETAIITLGQEVPFIRNTRITDTGQQINTVEYDDIGIILEVTPYITPDGLVQMYVAPEISTLTGDTVSIQAGVNAPVIAKRSAETNVVVPDGMTVVIGGLMETNKTESTKKIPLLGDIPLIGFAFKRTIKSKVKTELLIFLTPHVIARTSGLQRMAADEVSKTELAPRVFTQKELEQHLDNAEKLGFGPEAAPNHPRTLIDTMMWWK
jgi:general secretion pathway protein D